MGSRGLNLEPPQLLSPGCWAGAVPLFEFPLHIAELRGLHSGVCEVRGPGQCPGQATGSWDKLSPELLVVSS